MQTPQEEAPPEQEPEQSQPLHLTSLSIELQRDGQNAQQLLDAVKILPQELQTALASYDVTVDEITMTVGSSHTATVQALESGSIDLALLSAEALAEQSTAAAPIALSGPLFWDQGEDLAAWNQPPGRSPPGPGLSGVDLCSSIRVRKESGQSRNADLGRAGPGPLGRFVRGLHPGLPGTEPVAGRSL